MTTERTTEKRPPKWWLLRFLLAVLVMIVIFDFVLPMGFWGTTGPNGRKHETRRTTDQLHKAIINFFTEYRYYPTVETSSTTGAVHLSNNSLLDILIGSQPGSEPTEVVAQLNPQNISFFFTRKAKGNRSGIAIHPDGTHELFDAWGYHYRVIMDTNRDAQITPPSWTGLKDPIQENVIVWSPGPDGKDETAKDNITTW